MIENIRKKTGAILFRLPTFKNNHGFSLVEVIIVLVIIGVLSAIAYPGVSKWIPSYRLKEASRDLFTNMQKAKIEAVKENKDWAIYFDVANDRYYVCSDAGADDDWTAIADNTVEMTINFSQYKNGIGYGTGNATLSVPGGALPGDSVSYTSNVVTFTPEGLGLLGYVYLENENNTSTYAVGTSIGGVIKLKKWMGAAWE